MLFRSINRADLVKKRSLDFLERLVRLEKASGKEGMEAQKEFWRGLRSFNSLTDPAYAQEVLEAVLVLDKKRAGEGKESLLLNIFNKSNSKYDADIEDMINTFGRSTDPTIITYLKDLKKAREENAKFMERIQK